MAKEPASIRFKNPGAMWGNALAVKWGAQRKAVTLNDGKGQGNNIAVFPTFVQGICAQLDLWRSSSHYKNKRFCDAIAIWSGGNSVESYIAFVLKRVPGMTRNTVMDDAFWQSPNGIAFLKAQAWHEAGKKYPAPDADWIEAQRRVFDGLESAPTEPSTAAVTAVRTTGIGTLVGTVVTQAASTINGPVADKVEQVKEVVTNSGDVIASTREIVSKAPAGTWEKAMAFVQSPKFLLAALIIVLIAWGLTYYLRARKEQPA